MRLLLTQSLVAVAEYNNNIGWHCCLIFASLTSLQSHLLHLSLFHQPLSSNFLGCPQTLETFEPQTIVPTLILFISGRPFCGIGIIVLVPQCLLLLGHRWMRVVNDPRECGYGPQTSR